MTRHGSGPHGIAEESRPGGRERLGLDRGGGGSFGHGQPAPAPAAKEPKPGFFKRIERYFSAFFKLGRTARLAKSASHSVQVLEPRMDGLGDAIADMAARTSDLDIRAADIEARIDETAADLRSALTGLGEAQGRIRSELDATLRGANGFEGRIDAMQRSLDAQRDDFRGEIDRLGERLDGLRGDIAALGERLDRHAEENRVRDARLASDQAQISRAYSDIGRRMDLLRFGAGEAEASTPPGPPPVRREGLDALLDAFYNRLEDRYRGSRAEIKDRLRIYLPDVKAAVERTGLPVADLGCGRGEWVELLGEEEIIAFGIDLNPVQISDAQALGLDVREGDALGWLAEAPDASRSVITAHHLVEHLPFETVTWMTREALRVLAPGGVLIYETPNARNLIVGATTFNIDPTHVKPLPAEVLTTLLDTCGYHPVEARPLHPSDTLEVFNASKRADPHIAELLFGPQDLAVIGTRPGGG